MNAYRLKPLQFPWPPLLYGLAITAAYMLGTIVSLPSPQLSAFAGWAFGAALVTLAVSLDIWAVKTLMDCHTTVMPHRCTTHLVMCGPFRFTRNPIYLGYTLMTLGLGLLTGNSWFFVAAIVAAIVTTIVAIRREEMHLLARFGIEFETYCKKTRRWI